MGKTGQYTQIEILEEELYLFLLQTQKINKSHVIKKIYITQNGTIGVDARVNQRKEKRLKIIITRLNFSVIHTNALLKAGIQTLDDLSSWTEQDLLKIHNFGEKGLQKVTEALTAKGLTLAQTVDT